MKPPDKDIMNMKPLAPPRPNLKRPKWIESAAKEIEEAEKRAQAEARADQHEHELPDDAAALEKLNRQEDFEHLDDGAWLRQFEAEGEQDKPHMGLFRLMDKHLRGMKTDMLGALSARGNKKLALRYQTHLEALIGLNKKTMGRVSTYEAEKEATNRKVVTKLKAVAETVNKCYDELHNDAIARTALHETFFEKTRNPLVTELKVFARNCFEELEDTLRSRTLG